MAVYLDTSILIPLFFREPTSLAARERLRKEAGISGVSAITISRWTLTEFASAAAFKIRNGQTDEATTQQALGKLRTIVADGGLSVAEVIAADFERAAQFCTAHACGLRTPDALHAAIAARLKQTVLTSDLGLAKGCQYHGIGHEIVGAPS
jgi:predicted nucleic acid-binding protein